MGIVDEDIVRVREGTDVVAVVSEYTQLKRVGRRWTGLCPFHTEKSPSFSVNSEDGLYYCFGCQVGGDIITFVQEREQLDFVGAVERLAHKAGVTLRYTDNNQGEDRRRKNSLHDVLGRAVDWYHERLMTHEDAGAARSYLRRRGYDGDVVRRYKVGWAPEGWDTLAKALRLSDTDLTDSGLGFLNRFSRQQDSFRGRVMFPIFDAQANAVGFGGRIMPGADGSKYKNSAESPVYAKSRVLYGLNWAKQQIVEADEVIVCEGYTDVIGFSEAGAGRAVATCGTALTDEHVKILRRFAKRVVLAFDADAAGQNAAARFYEWEKAHDLDVAVADLPEGVDPGELAIQDPERLREAITGARPFLEFRVVRAIDAIDKSTAEGRARAAEQALAMVAEHPDPLVRDQYVMMVASRCQFQPELIRTMLAEGPKATVVERRVAGRKIERRDSAEFEALRLAIQQSEDIVGLLLPELFIDPLCASVYDLLLKFSSLHEVIDNGGPEVAELVQRLSVEESEADPMDVAGRLWERFLDRQIETCRLEARTVDTDRYAMLAEDMKWFRRHLDDLREPDRRTAAVEGLLGWMIDGSEEVA